MTTRNWPASTSTPGNALYQATFDPRWYQAAHNPVDTATALFWVAGEGFYDTSFDAEEPGFRAAATPRHI
jgi:uncharacterized protein YyaL (SSP411 family)